MKIDTAAQPAAGVPSAPTPVYTRFPVAVCVDHREKLPYTFERIRADKAEGADLVLVESRTCHLETGDYTLDGYASRYAVERKSLEDLYCTLGQHRDRFEAELFRLNMLTDGGDVVIEAGVDTIAERPPEFSKLLPKTVSRSIIAWRFRFPRVQWWTMPDRRYAEAWTFQLLRRVWKNNQEK